MDGPELLRKLKDLKGREIPSELRKEIARISGQEIGEIDWSNTEKIIAWLEGLVGPGRPEFESEVNKVVIDRLVEEMDLSAQEKEEAMALIEEWVRRGGELELNKGFVEGLIERKRELLAEETEKLETGHSDWLEEEVAAVAEVVSSDRLNGVRTETGRVRVERLMWQTAKDWGQEVGADKPEVVMEVVERLRARIRDRTVEVGGMKDGKTLKASLLEQGISLSDPEVKMLTTRLLNYINDNKGEVMETRREMVKKEIWEEMVRLNPKMKLAESLDYSELLTKLSYLEPEAALEVDRAWSGEISQTTLEQTRVVINILKGKENVLSLAKRFRDIAVPNKVNEARVADEILGIISRNPRMARIMEAGRKIFQMKEAMTRGAMLTSGFINNSMIIIQREGIAKGIRLISGSIMRGGVKAVAEAAVLKEGAKALATKAISGLAVKAAGLVAGPGGWVVTAASFVGDVVGGWGKKFFEKTLGIKLPWSGLFLGIKKIVKKIPGLGPVGKVVIEFGENLLNALFVGLAASVGALITAVVVGVFGFLFLYQVVFKNNMISSLVPPLTGRGGETEVFISVTVPTIDPNIALPESCLSGWPMASGAITQGPNGAYSHKNPGVQAIDIGTGEGSLINATHNGVAALGRSSGYGYFVDIHAKCNGIKFVTRYAHMIDHDISNMKEVSKGEIIGRVTGVLTGRSTGSHLHYQLYGLGEINNYLPKTVEDSCNSRAECGIVL